MSLQPLMPPKILTILEYPAPILKEVCQHVAEITDEFRRLAKDMIYTLSVNKSGGIGLSAPQVGVPARLLVMLVPGKPPTVMFNPVVRRYAPSYITRQEGCLSFPGVVMNIRRPKWVAISYQDMSGARVLRKYHGLEGQCVMHELDHLEGKLFK